MTKLWAVISFLKSLPKLLSELTKVWEAISNGLKKFKQSSMDKKVKDAVAEAKETKDTSKLEEHFNPGGDESVSPSRKVRRRSTKLDS